jgi:DNA-binding NarL/FixJ family response regulator
MKSKGIRVAFVDDDRWLRDRLTHEMKGLEGYECVAACPSAEEALRILPGLAPDVVVLDINLPGMSGIECLRRLKPQCPETQFLMLTVYEENELIFQSLVAGASGYLLKRTSTKELLNAIRQVKEGGGPMSIAIARRVIQYFNQQGTARSDVETLSPRERQVLDLLVHGSAYKQIADELAVGIETVRTYVKQIYTKLHVHSRGEAVAKYLTPP